MKSTLVFVFFFLLSCQLFAQYDGGGFAPRKGKILLETGYSLSGVLIGGGSGFSLIVDDGATLTSLGFDGGYFFSDDLAVRGRLNLLSAGSDGESATLTGLGAGLKYYLAGKFPVSADAGIITGGGGGTIFTYNANAGFAIRLADNIALEPSIGLANVDGDGALRFALNFAMFL